MQLYVLVLLASNLVQFQTYQTPQAFCEKAAKPEKGARVLLLMGVRQVQPKAAGDSATLEMVPVACKREQRAEWKVVESELMTEKVKPE